MNLTLTKLKELIKEEMMNETQKALGLPQVFNNFDLAKRIYAAINDGAPDGDIEALRNMALQRIKLVRRDIGQGIDVENKTQEDTFLQHAVDHIDTTREDYANVTYSSSDPTFKSHMGISDEGPYAGRPLRRRERQHSREMSADSHRHIAKQRALRKAGKPYLPYAYDFYGLDSDLSENMDEAKKKKPCKPSKGKRFAKRVDGKCRSYGQKGKAKGGGDRIRPGTKKGDAYCARSLKIKKCKNPPCANALSRKKWKCRGAKSMK